MLTSQTVFSLFLLMELYIAIYFRHLTVPGDLKHIAFCNEKKKKSYQTLSAQCMLPKWHRLRHNGPPENVIIWWRQKMCNSWETLRLDIWSPEIIMVWVTLLYIKYVSAQMICQCMAVKLVLYCSPMVHLSKEWNEGVLCTPVISAVYSTFVSTSVPQMCVQKSQNKMYGWMTN